MAERTPEPVALGPAKRSYVSHVRRQETGVVYPEALDHTDFRGPTVTHPTDWLRIFLSRRRHAARSISWRRRTVPVQAQHGRSR